MRLERLTHYLAGGLMLVLVLMGADVYAQAPVFNKQRVLELLPVESIARNSVSNLEAEGDTLWVGPALDMTTNGGESWQRANADSLIEGRGRVFSVDVEGPVIWAGLGFSAAPRGEDEPVPTAGGFVVSRDGGTTWQYQNPPLDAPDDTTETYGGSLLPALPVIVPQQSPPYDIDYHAASQTVWTAGWASGIRRSADGGKTWDRIVLPPDTLSALYPDSTYTFPVGPERTAEEEANNFLGFSVLVDETGTVWAGTAAGLNRSAQGAFHAPDSLAWQRFVSKGSAESIVSNWVISIEEQLRPNARNPVWIASWRAGGSNERYGVTVTRDGGETFEPMLIGEKVNDLAFQGDTVLAAGDNGLLISANNGETWRTVRSFQTTGQTVLRSDLEALAVAATPEAIWVGTNDGLLKSIDGARTWTVFRTQVPTRPEQPTDQIPALNTYAYPNPFSAAKDQYVRLRYELGQSQRVEVRIFDFRMNLVRTLTNEQQPAGDREEIWDGTDANGQRVANGTYFYSIKTERNIYRGKILVLE